MKKFWAGLLAVLSLSACSENRDNVLKVYNWSDYIGEGIIEEFEQWYQEQTGEEIKVIYQTFDVNESMLAKIEKGHEDFDVVCPSDYIIERMLNNDLLMPLDFEAIPDSLDYISNNRSEYIANMFRSINPNVDANDYSVAYMWGTTGLIYNSKFVTDEEAASWNSIRNPKFAGKIFMKDAPRDVYGPVLIYLRQKELQEGTVTLDDLMHDSSDKSIADVEEFMMEARELFAGWEADFGKDQLVQERAYLSLNWSGDAIWAIEEAAEIGVDLRYIVPEEGSTVWFDGWVIPKYAKNVKAATWFINFMCRPDIAIRNMDETGYVSANGDISVLESQIDEELDPIDVSYFFGPQADSVRVNPAMYPSREIIERCALEHDWGQETDKLIAMWSRVKGQNANNMTYIIIAAVIVIAAVVALRAQAVKKNRKKSKRK